MTLVNTYSRVNAGVPCVLGCVGNLYLRDTYLSMKETIQITGLFWNWISALDGNPTNFISSPPPFLKGQPALFRWEAVCSERGDHSFAAPQVGKQSRARDVVLSSRGDLP